MKNLLTQTSLKTLFIGAALFFAGCGQDRDASEETTTTATEEPATGTTDTSMAHDTTMRGGRMGGMMGHMHQHMQDMGEMRSQMTGDPDYDFALMMTRHHQGGIRLSEEEVASGTDSKLKEVANRIITTNRGDDIKLQDFTSSHKTATGDTTTTMRMMQPMRKMMSGMGQGRMGMGMDMDTTNVDQNFANMMIRHHQMGNEMARELLKLGKTDQMKQLAQKIIDQQENEIKELQAWQKQNPQ